MYGILGNYISLKQKCLWRITEPLERVLSFAVSYIILSQQFSSDLGVVKVFAAWGP